MNTYIIETRLTKEEREVTINISEIDNKAYAETSIAKYRTKFLKQGWTETSATTLPDGTWVCSEFEAPISAVLIGKAQRAKREFTDEQKAAIAERMKNARIQNK